MNKTLGLGKTENVHHCICTEWGKYVINCKKKMLFTLLGLQSMKDCLCSAFTNGS